MKYLILFLITLNCFANYIPKSKVGIETNLTVWTNQSKCQKKENESCIKIDSNYNPAYSEIKPITQMKEQVESCLDESDCQEKLELLSCEKGEAIKSLDQLEVYCTWLRPEMVLPNESLKSAYEAQKSQERAMETALNQAKFQMNCGKDVIALMSVRNVSKNLTEVQMESLVSTYSMAKSLLETGALETAKANIQGQTADGVIVTEGDKTALVDKINDCLGI